MLSKWTKSEEREGCKLTRSSGVSASCLCVHMYVWQSAPATGGWLHPRGLILGRRGSKLDRLSTWAKLLGEIALCVYVCIYFFTSRSPSCAARKRRMRLLVLPVFMCLLYVFVCVTLVCEPFGMCLIGINFQASYWLDVGTWNSGSLTSQSFRSGMAFCPSIILIRYSEHESWEQGVSLRSFLIYGMEERGEVFSEVGILMKKEKKSFAFLAMDVTSEDLAQQLTSYNFKISYSCYVFSLFKWNA